MSLPLDATPTSAYKRRRRRRDTAGAPAVDALLVSLGNERESTRKTQFRSVITEIYNLLETLSSSFLAASAVATTLSAVNNSLIKACANIESLSNKANAILASLEAGANNSQRTYANVASLTGAVSTAAQSKPSQAGRVVLAHGKSIQLSNFKRIYVGPSEQAKEHIKSSASTKEALITAIKPPQHKLHVRRLLHGPNNSVIIEGDESLNDNAFQNNRALADVGLEVKRPQKLNPRIIIHDVPVALAKDEIVH